MEDSAEDIEKMRVELNEESPSLCSETPTDGENTTETGEIRQEVLDIPMEDEIVETDTGSGKQDGMPNLVETIEKAGNQLREDIEMEEDLIISAAVDEVIGDGVTLDVVKESEVPSTETLETAGETETVVEEQPPQGPYFWEYNFDTEWKPIFLAEASSEFSSCEFLKGCKWAPDGSCLLTNSDDSKLRVFNFPENVSHVQDWNNVSSGSIQEDRTWTSALSIREGGLIYDYNWYPFASSMDPATTVFLTTTKDTPIHLWDATYGNLRATYLAYNDVDEPTAAYSVSFDASGEKIFAGYDKSIRIFNIARPGRQCIHRKLTTSLLPDLNQHGLISCFAFNPAWSNVYACGSYRKSIGLYMEDGSVISVLEGHVGGVTHLAFSRDGTKLYSGARSDSSLLCWDLRNMSNEYKVYKRVVKTQQRIYFELTTDDKYLISGGTDGIVRLWDTSKENQEPHLIPSGSECINGVSINPYVPVLAIASGQRKLDQVIDDSDDETFVAAVPKHVKVCDIKLWKL
ncbi:unnamed protein product [Allacma fusca]|uniref:WD repeat-containing protein 79 n=1 Tax=Allacma fusca TaxID=39272 RepID=A0A8J2LDS2_9HEXA|nr:unnamed protein product [Allacma fusca]